MGLSKRAQSCQLLRKPRINEMELRACVRELMYYNGVQSRLQCARTRAHRCHPEPHALLTSQTPAASQNLSGTVPSFPEMFLDANTADRGRRLRVNATY